MTVPSQEFNGFKDAVDARFKTLETDLKANTAATKRVESNTAEIVSAFDSAKGAFKVLEFFGKLAKPMIWIVGLGTTVAFNAATLKTYLATLLAGVFK